MTIIARKFQNQSNGNHRSKMVKTPDPLTSQEFIQLSKKLKASQAEANAHSLSGVCKAQKAAHAQVERHTTRIDSAMVALHSSLDDGQRVTPEQFVQVLGPFTDNVLEKGELLEIFHKLDAKSRGCIAIQLNEAQNRKASQRMEQQLAEMKKRKSALARMQNAVGAVQNMRKSLKAMLVSKKSKKIAPCCEFDNIAPKVAPAKQAHSSELGSSKQVTSNDNDHSESEDEEQQELELLQKKIEALKAAKEAKEKEASVQKKQRDEKMEALRKELEALQSDVEDDC